MARPRLSLRRDWFVGVLVATLAVTPAISVQAAGWSEWLEPAPWIALAGVIVGAVLAQRPLGWISSHLLGLLGGFVAVTSLYASFVLGERAPERLWTFLNRVADWLGAALSGAASTDNLLFAYTMGLLAWLLGYVGAWTVFRTLGPWWAIVPSGAGLLLNLSYAPPDLLTLVVFYLLASFALLSQLTSAAKTVRWEAEHVEATLQQGSGFALTSFAMGVAILFAAWRMPVGEVHRGVAATWEAVAGPWQGLQTNFDRLFASLSPSTLSGRGLTVAQSMAPRGSFELGDRPIMRVAGREPAYWRAATYDRYTGYVMTGSRSTTQRLERRQPVDGALEIDEGRKFVEYGVTFLAPSTSVLYAPEAPVTISVPTVYEYRADRKDYGSLRPVIPVREQQRYSLLASVSTASIAELRQTGTAYPAWVRTYLQLPPKLPDPVRQEAWRVVGDATNVYDAASAIEHHLRGFRYSTRVSVPPGGRDWVSFLLFDSKEGYCDYFATAMTVMLRTVGVPARVATGYVTGDWDPLTQSYLVTERHAHSWTEVYFPRYGWITFEPSANRPAPARLDRPITPLSDEELLRLMEADFGLDEFFDDEDLYDGGAYAPINMGATGPPLPLPVMAVLTLLGLLLAGLLAVGFLWFQGIKGLPASAQPYAQVVRLATWCRLGPRNYQTPYEYTRHLGELAPSASDALQVVGHAYVQGRYGGRDIEQEVIDHVVRAGNRARSVLFQTLAIERLRSWAEGKLREISSAERPR